LEVLITGPLDLACLRGPKQNICETSSGVPQLPTAPKGQCLAHLHESS
jgi:hypothetical protein